MQFGDSNLLDLTHDLILRISASRLIIDVNQPACDSLGTRDQLIGKPADDIVAIQSRDLLDSCLETSLSGISVTGANLTLSSHDKREIRVQANFHLRELDADKSIYIFCRSLSEQEAVRQALRESEKLLRTVLGSMPDVLLIIDDSGRYLQIFTANDDLLAYPKKDMIGTTLYDNLSKAEADLGMDVIKQVVEHKRAYTTEYQLKLKGTTRWFDAHVVPFELTPKSRSVLWVSRDVTDLVIARKKLTADQELLRSLLELEMQAREVVAYEIHDGFVQHAVGTQMWLQALDKLVDRDNEEIARAMNVALDSITQGVADARAMIRDLRPVVFRGQGLLNGLSQLIRVMQKKTERPIRFLCDQPPPELLDLLEGQVFRIVQESLNNVIRHSNASEATVWLHGDSAKLHVEITDNGTGFDPEQVPSGRYGLEGIARRAKVFGGSCKVDSESGLGTRIRITLPVIGPEEKLSTITWSDSVEPDAKDYGRNKS